MGSAEDETAATTAAAVAATTTATVAAGDGGGAPASPPASAASKAPSDWAHQVQAYYSSGAGAAAAAAASGQAPAFHPFYLGPQQFYASAVPFPAVYFAHPSMAVSVPHGTAPSEVKPPALSKGKNKEPASKEGSGNQGGSPGSSGDGGKGNSGPAKRVTRSDRSSSGGSSDTREDDSETEDISVLEKRSFKDTTAEGKTSLHRTVAQSVGSEAPCPARGRTVAKLPVSAPGRTALPSSLPNLNVGMNLWNTTNANAEAMQVRANDVNDVPELAGQDMAMPNQHQFRAELALRRERRKQSNRESARRSRLRKQQQCENLARTVAEQNYENSELKAEIERYKKLCMKLTAENEVLLNYANMSNLGLACAYGVRDSVHVEQTPTDTSERDRRVVT